MHACEWNPDSIEALEINLKQNSLRERCTIHPGTPNNVKSTRGILLLVDSFMFYHFSGDNAICAPKLKGIADRVLLGLIPSSEKAWKLAVDCLKDTGGILHVHANVKDSDTEDFKSHLLGSLQGHATERFGGAPNVWTIALVHVEVVKSYAPHIYHIVVDVECKMK